MGTVFTLVKWMSPARILSKIFHFSLLLGKDPFPITPHTIPADRFEPPAPFAITGSGKTSDIQFRTPDRIAHSLVIKTELWDVKGTPEFREICFFAQDKSGFFHIFPKYGGISGAFYSREMGKTVFFVSEIFPFFCLFCHRGDPLWIPVFFCGARSGILKTSRPLMPA
jgi:hypothetical protein